MPVNYRGTAVRIATPVPLRACRFGGKFATIGPAPGMPGWHLVRAAGWAGFSPGRLEGGNTGLEPASDGSRCFVAFSALMGQPSS